MAEVEESPQIAPSAEKKTAKKKEKGKKKKKGDSKTTKLINAKGEIVSGREYTLQKALDDTTHSLNLARERIDNLIKINQNIQDDCTQQEKDALEVIAALQKENEANESKIRHYQERLADQEKSWSKKEDEIRELNEKKLTEFNAILSEKDAAFKVMQQEFVVIKDFRKKRHELMKELENSKSELAETDKRHKDTINRLERKFFEDKLRLQQEANRKISELAAKAHEEAVMNLSETSKDVFKDNLKMAEALQFHVLEGEELNRDNKQLGQLNKKLSQEKELHNVIVKEKITETKKQASTIKELNLKIHSMEHSLSHVVREFEHEREIIGNLAKKELTEVRKIALKLKMRLEKKTQEMKHIRRLAQHILDQRSDLEEFFMDALDQTRNEIFIEKEVAKKKAEIDFNKQLRQAIFNKDAQMPSIKSFRPQVENIIKSIENEQHNAAEIKTNQVDLKELTWNDRERVLRVLFAKMNGVATTKNSMDKDVSKSEIHAYQGGQYSTNLNDSTADRIDRVINIDDKNIPDDNFQPYLYEPQANQADTTLETRLPPITAITEDEEA